MRDLECVAPSRSCATDDLRDLGDGLPRHDALTDRKLEVTGALQAVGATIDHANSGCRFTSANPPPRQPRDTIVQRHAPQAPSIS